MYKWVYYVCAHMYIYYVNVYVFVDINVYVLFMCVYVCRYKCIYFVYMCICAYLCVNIHVHIYSKHILFPIRDIYQPFNANKHLEAN